MSTEPGLLGGTAFGTIIDLIQVGTVIIGGWIAYVLNNITKDQQDIRREMQEAIVERNERLAIVNRRADEHEKSMAAFRTEFQACNVTHVREAERAKLRSEDLERIGASMSELFRRVNTLAEQAAERKAHVESIREALAELRALIEKSLSDHRR